MDGLRVPNGQPVYFSTGTILVNKFYKTITEMSGLLRAIYLIGSQFKLNRQDYVTRSYSTLFKVFPARQVNYTNAHA